MGPAAVARLISGLEPVDDLTRSHRDQALAWLAVTDDIYRRVSPATPPTHLVVYVVLQDPTDAAVLLVRHRKAGLWLPTGGHVEPGEDPRNTVRREAREELGIDVAGRIRVPTFVTVTPTVGSVDTRHTDVSLWYAIRSSRSEPLTPDWTEFFETRWWTPAEVTAAPSATLEPHLLHYLSTTSRELAATGPSSVR